MPAESRATRSLRAHPLPTRSVVLSSVAFIAVTLPFIGGCNEPGEAPGRVVFVEHAAPDATRTPEPGAPERAPLSADAPESDAKPKPDAAADAVIPAPPAADPDAELLAQRRDDEQQQLERAFPRYGACYHFLGQVFAAPSMSAPVVGYMRRGAQFRAKDQALAGDGCSNGFYEVMGGGYVCRGRGFLIGDKPQSFEPSPSPPALDDALPYVYGWAPRDGILQYWRVPNPDEEKAARAALERRARKAIANLDSKDVDEVSEDVEAPPPPGTEAEAQEPSSAETAEKENALPSFVRMVMQKGFFVSLDQLEEHPHGRFYRTVRGGYLREDELVPNTPTEFRGVLLGTAMRLPLAIAYRGGVQRLYRDPSSGALREAGHVERHAAFTISDVLVRHDNPFVVAIDGFVVRKNAIRTVDPIARPAEVPDGAKWIHVKLSEQALTAYQGDQPVFATLVSTGRKGFETPTGLFQIQSKHVSTTMDDLTSEDGAYSIEDVPWTMYFEGSYALHAAFWHDGFGRPRSHGCVNLAPADARWLFAWSTPELPPAFHGVFARTKHEGTFVLIEP